MRWAGLVAVAALLGAPHTPAPTTVVRWSPLTPSGAVKPALTALEPSWVARSGHRLQVSYATAGELRAKLAAGAQADIVILPLEKLRVSSARV